MGSFHTASEGSCSAKGVFAFRGDRGYIIRPRASVKAALGLVGNEVMYGRFGKITTTCLLLLTGTLLPGCSDSGNKPAKLRRLEGVAKQIDLKTGVVSMLWKNDKGEERILEGTVKEDAEIWINGRAQRLEDIRVGDKVVVFGTREKKGGEEKLIATRVEVTRPQETDWKTVGKSATTQPAEKENQNNSRPAASP